MTNNVLRLPYTLRHKTVFKVPKNFIIPERVLHAHLQPLRLACVLPLIARERPGATVNVPLLRRGHVLLIQLVLYEVKLPRTIIFESVINAARFLGKTITIRECVTLSVKYN